ncbi:MAG: PadR family transcriptional regulator [Pseudanabaenales cyanobacterium]|nr:PadR family transcriptional regulator [Pseudanabaenales cyanobacterium]
MKFEDIYQFFEDPPPIYLNKELAVCYVLAVLIDCDSYGTELIQLLGREYPDYRLSDTVLYSALKFLEDQSAIVGYWKKVEGRGRPRRMYRLCPEYQLQARELGDLWLQYMRGRRTENPLKKGRVLTASVIPRD